MAFPTTGILDDFNRGDEGPPMTDWTDLVNGHEVVSNACNNDNTAASQNVSMYDADTYGDDCEVYVTLTQLMDFRLEVALRTTTLVLGTHDGYRIGADISNDEIEIRRVDNGANTLLGAAVSFAWANGDKIGGEAIGGTIKGYIDDGGAGWAEKISRADANHGSAGYVGLRSLSNSADILDDFGGGTVVPAAAGNPWYQYAQEQ